MKIIFIFPLLFLSLILYVILMLFNLGFEQNWQETIFFTMNLSSGDQFNITFGLAFLLLSFLLLNIELVKSTRSNSNSIFNHVLSVLVFVLCLLLFLLVKGFGNSTFFLLTIMTLTDFLVGFIISTVSARRDIGLGAGTTSID